MSSLHLTPTLLRSFRDVWAGLERRHLVDALGSAQYRRIFQSWLRVECKPHPYGFILGARVDVLPAEKRPFDREL